MKYHIFGNTGLRVSQLCLGTMTFGAESWGTNEQQSKEILAGFFERGGNFIDTANIYAGGASEKIIGAWLSENNGRRHQAVVATKYTLSSNNANPNAHGSGRKNLLHSIENSLKNLRTSYIDVLFVHSFDRHTPLEQCMRALDDVVQQGKVLHIAVSNVPAWQVARANAIASSKGLTTFSGTQIYYNLIERSAERELLPMAAQTNITTTVWSPLAGGLLTGKYYDDKNSHKNSLNIGNKNTNLSKKELSDLPRLQQKESIIFKNRSGKEAVIVAKLLEVAKKINRPPHHLALAWMMQKPGIGNVIPIVGAKNISQLQDNLESINLQLSEDVLTQLDDLSSFTLGYPHDFLKLQSPSIYGDYEKSIMKNLF